MAWRPAIFVPFAGSIFPRARQIGTSVAVTAASARLSASWLAVLCVVQPPQLNPTIMVRMEPSTAPQMVGLSHAACICMRHLLLGRTIGEYDLSVGTARGRRCG